MKPEKKWTIIHQCGRWPYRNCFTSKFKIFDTYDIFQNFLLQGRNMEKYINSFRETVNVLDIDIETKEVINFSFPYAFYKAGKNKAKYLITHQQHVTYHYRPGGNVLIINVHYFAFKNINNNLHIINIFTDKFEKTEHDKQKNPEEFFMYRSMEEIAVDYALEKLL